MQISANSYTKVYYMISKAGYIVIGYLNPDDTNMNPYQVDITKLEDPSHFNTFP